MFDTTEECHQKLGGTIVLRGTTPFYVHQAMSPTTVMGKTPGPGEMFVVGVEELSFRTIGQKLGYMNFSSWQGSPYKEAMFLMKQAIRRTTAGLSQANVWVEGFKGDGNGLGATGRLVFASDIYQANIGPFTDMLNNRYPSMKSVRDEMVKDSSIHSKAFHRWWCVERDPVGPFYFVYKTQRVGYTEDFSKFVINDRFRFLRDDLKELACA